MSSIRVLVIGNIAGTFYLKMAWLLVCCGIYSIESTIYTHFHVLRNTYAYFRFVLYFLFYFLHAVSILFFVYFYFDRFNRHRALYCCCFFGTLCTYLNVRVFPIKLKPNVIHAVKVWTFL